MSVTHYASNAMNKNLTRMMTTTLSTNVMKLSSKDWKIAQGVKHM